MSTAKYSSTKQELINWISNLKDVGLLNLLNSIRMSLKEPNKDWWDELTEPEKENILLGLKDIKEGKTMSSEQFWNKLRSE